MGLKVFSIGSSSSGNSYIIKGGSTALLLDVGLSGKKIKEGISEVGLSLQDIQGILVTHEHVDHVKSVRMMAKNCLDATVIGSAGTIANCSSFESIDDDRIKRVAAGEVFTIGDIEVAPFGLSHDAAEPISYTFRYKDDTLSVVTDTGIVNGEIYEELLNANKLVFEANHEEDLLMVGPYPYSVKRRILSDVGHLSNITSGEVLARVLEEKRYEAKPKIMLAHLSSQNNTPSQAEWRVKSKLSDFGFEESQDYDLQIALKEGLSVLE